MKSLAILLMFLLVFGVGCGKKVEEQGMMSGEEEGVMTGVEGMASQEEVPLSMEETLPEQRPVFVKPDIKDIQVALQNAGLYEGAIDGVSGPKTKQAIEDFQAQNNLNVDGKVGPKTWEKLKLFLNQAE
jgi:peptidoglycan hydrolase-like protein with peptidoglycan-binding domain